MKHIATILVIGCPPESSIKPLLPALQEQGMTVLIAADGLKAFEMARQSGVELVVLAEPLSILSGKAVCSALREAKATAPILLLDEPQNAIQGLVAGADVVLASGSSQELILAQVQALLRRVALDSSPLQAGDLTLDTTTRRAERGGKVIPLSATEYTLLELLMRRVGRVVSREEIMEHVWPGESRTSDNVLDVYVSYLRTKVDRDFPTALIRTVRGQGYMVITQ